MKKSSSSSSLHKQQQQQQQQQRRRNRSRSSSANNHRHGNNNGNSNNMKPSSNNNTRGQSPRPNNNNRQNSSSSLRNRNRSRSNNSSRRNNNSADDKYRSNNYIHRQEKPKSISRSKLHMPHIIPNISPNVLLNKKHSNTKNGRGKSHDDGGRRRRGRSSTPKTRGEESSHSFSNTLRRSLSSGNRKSLSNNNSTSRKRSAFRLRSFSTGDRSAAKNNLRRSRSATSFQHRQQQHYDNDDNYNGRRRSMSSGRMNNSSSSNTKPSWMTDRSNRNDTNQRKRRRGKSMPARFLDNMPNLGFWKGNANNNNNHANNRWNAKNDDREEKKIKTKNNHHLEASFPDLQKEMKRLSSSRGSRERGRKSSTNPSHGGNNNNTTTAAARSSNNEWGAKPRGRSRLKHTSRNRSDTNNNNNNKDQIKDLEAEVATIATQKPASVLTEPPPPPPPPRFPPPPFHHGQQQQQQQQQQQSTKNNGNYNRSKSLPRNFQRYSLLDVMVEMEKEIEVPLRKKYSHNGSSNGNGGGASRNTDFDSVISPIASMDSSWRYKEDIFLMKSMASLSASRRGRGRGRGGGVVPSTTTRMKSGSGGFDSNGRYDDPRMSHGISSRQQQQQPLQPAVAPIRAPPPPPLAPPVSARIASARIVGDINDIDGDDDEEEEEDVIDFNDIDGDDDDDEKEDDIDIPIPRRPKSVPPRVEEEENEEESSRVSSENDENDTNAINSDETEDKSSTASKEEKTQVSESLRTNDDFTFRSSIVRPEPISSVYGSSATESPEVPTNHVTEKESSSHDSSDSAGGGSSSSSGGEGDSLIGYASVASDEKVGSIAPPPHSSIRRKKPGAISVGASPLGGDRSSATHSMGTLSRMHNELQRKMSELQDGLDEHGRPVKELDLDLTSMDSSTGRVSDLTLPTVLMKAPPPASRIRAMKPKPLTTRRTKKGTLELQGDIDAMKSLAVSELSMSSPVQSAYPKSMSMRMTSYKKTVNNAPSAAAATPPPPRRASGAPSSRHARRNTQPKPEIAPIVESSEEYADTLTKKSTTRSLHSRHSYGTALSAGTTSQMPMKPASGAGHRHAPPPPKHRPAGTKIDIGDVAQQLQMMQGQAVNSLPFAVAQGQGVAASSVGSGNGSRSRQYTPKAGGGNSVSSSVKHSSVEGMKWSDKFGKTGRYSGDVNADYIPNGMGSMQYNFGLTVEGRWVDGTILSNDLDQGFAV